MQVSQGFTSLEIAKLNFSDFLGPAAAPTHGESLAWMFQNSVSRHCSEQSQATAARPLLEMSIATWKHHFPFQIQVAILEMK